MTDTGAVMRWLIAGAPGAAAAEEVLSGTCERLLAAGLPLTRAAAFVEMLHPDIMGRALIWRAGEGVSINDAPLAFRDSDVFRDSPVSAVGRTGVGLRRRLIDPGCPFDFPILADLREQGVTDFLAMPLRFTNGDVQVGTWATAAPQGFADPQVAALEALMAPLARLAEIWAMRRTATTLLDTYVGRNAGARILAGHIRRGDTESVRAAVWLSDLRGFTPLADRLSPAELTATLNLYFDCQVPAIAEHGGEVLKFLGDGLLAIFPAGVEAAAAATCAAALRAARQASAELAAKAPDLRHGLALHFGDVLWGNVGGGNRLDFTCIGPAVNLAARIEGMTADLGHPIIASQEFAHHAPEQLTPLGAFSLRGFATPQRLFAVPVLGA
ncbi:adenylate/guanylate cyclase domain-containing protein [Chelatococcus reniformis]|uniref:Adenylate cyclase n=1 Tax=Chelatococcus reniformis TaxID=1494448 RepID=A0A916XKW0_9HYPH|nr:adenylate/guanylate cyclase domain-containing protein [Chelatococcus reniformis]GGC82515.1 adenylate cyclase [Chelatococcus reniformis]